MTGASRAGNSGCFERASKGPVSRPRSGRVRPSASHSVSQSAQAMELASAHPDAVRRRREAELRCGAAFCQIPKSD